MWRDHPAGSHLDIRPPGIAQQLYQLGDQRLVPCGERACPHHIDLLLQRQRSGFLWGLKQRAGNHLETHICKRRCDHIRAAIMPVLPHLGDHDARFAAQPALYGVDTFGYLSPTLIKFVCGFVNPADRLWCRVMAPEHFFHCGRNLAQRRIIACSVYRPRKQIGVTLSGHFLQH